MWNVFYCVCQPLQYFCMFVFSKCFWPINWIWQNNINLNEKALKLAWFPVEFILKYCNIAVVSCNNVTRYECLFQIKCESLRCLQKRWNGSHLKLISQSMSNCHAQSQFINFNHFSTVICSKGNRFKFWCFETLLSLVHLTPVIRFHKLSYFRFSLSVALHRW